MRLTRLFVDPVTKDFARRGAFLFEILGHEMARALPFFIGGAAIVLALASLKLSSLRPWTTIFLLVGTAMILGPLAANSLKGFTAQHCPTAMEAFGGTVDYTQEFLGPFWATDRRSAGHCLPSGHAAGGYALLSLYFAGWAAGRPGWRWLGLGLGISLGLAFSIVRVAQGAHFPSATLWSALVDWTACALVFAPLLCGGASPANDTRHQA